MDYRKYHRIVTIIFVFTLLVACGGGGGGGGGVPTTPVETSFPPSTDFQDGVFRESSIFKDACEIPRTPGPGTSFPDYQGSLLAEKYWLRSWSNETYLWYDEIIDVDPASNYDKFDYFDLLKTNGVTPSGTPRDQFHFTRPTEQFEQSSQSGVNLSYGIRWIFGSNTRPRELYVAYVQPGSTAATAGVVRGMQIMEVDGVDFVNGNTQEIVNTINAGIFPSVPGESHTFGVLASGSTDTGTYPQLSLIAGNITNSPVPTTNIIETSTGDVGYIVFHEHIATAEIALADAISDLSTSSVTDLILDLRYNGGGYLAVASQLAYMIAGAANTENRTFEELQNNDKRTANNTLMPFINETIGLSAQSGQDLPTLDLNRVFIITGSSTCSASESIINGLDGIAVQIIMIGDTTCGKPYGFIPKDNCGTTYFTIQFRSVNDVGLHDYSDGFTPSNSGTAGVPILGCAVADDLSKELGDITEARLAAALAFRNTPLTCPTPPTASSLFSTQMSPYDQLDIQIHDRRSFSQTNRILGGVR